MKNNMGIFCERVRMSDDISLYLSSRGKDKQLSIATNITFEEVDDGTMAPPVYTFTQTQAQRFMDELWNCGLRPSEGSGSAGSLAATERHLADMRTLVFERSTVNMPIVESIDIKKEVEEALKNIKLKQQDDEG